MAEEELRYPSLRVVMQYLEANKRIQLVKRCPCLNYVDKAVPLSINHLYLGRSRVYLNNATYQIGIIRHYPPDGPKILKEYQRVNDLNGSDSDRDRFGKLDRSSNQLLTPGDIPVESAHGPVTVRVGEVEDAYMEQISRRLAHLKTLRKMKERKEEKKRIEAWLYEWNLRRENKCPPYSMYLKFTRKNPDKTLTIEYLEYNKKHHESMKYMYNFLLSGRKHPLTVRYLDIVDVGAVLRLPESLRVTARSLETGTNFGTVLNSIQPILMNKSFREIAIYDGLSVAANFDHPIIAETDSLNVCKVKLTGNMFEVVLNSKNRRFNAKKPKLTKEEYIELIEKMISDKRPADTCYSFGINKSLIKSLFKELRARDGVTSKKWNNTTAPRFPISHNFRVDESSLIDIYCSRNKGFNEKTRDNEPYKLWLKVRLFDKMAPAEVKKTEMKKGNNVKKVDEMLADDKEVGTCHSIEVHSKEIVRDLLNDIKARDGVKVKKEEKRGCTRFPLTYSIPIDESSKFAVHCNRNSNLNKKGGSKLVPWTLWIHVERTGETNQEDYDKLLNKLIADKNNIGIRYPVGVQTMKQVKELLSELRKRDGVIMAKQNRGSNKFPHTYSFAINDTSKLIVFCYRKQHYNEKYSTDKPWVLWHRVEKVLKKNAAKP